VHLHKAVKLQYYFGFKSRTEPYYVIMCAHNKQGTHQVVELLSFFSYFTKLY